MEPESVTVAVTMSVVPIVGVAVVCDMVTVVGGPAIQVTTAGALEVAVPAVAFSVEMPTTVEVILTVATPRVASVVAVTVRGLVPVTVKVTTVLVTGVDAASTTVAVTGRECLQPR